MKKSIISSKATTATQPVIQKVSLIKHEIIEANCKVDDDKITTKNNYKPDILLNPKRVYNNADLDKDKIIKENRDKSGIYR